MDATMNSQKYRPQKQHYYETEECSNQSECPIYGEWLAWSECSRTCGAGIRTRQTGAVDANSVADDFRLYETGTCNNEDCRKFFFLYRGSHIGSTSSTNTEKFYNNKFSMRPTKNGSL